MIRIQYKASVMVAAGWRSVTIEALAHRVGSRMARVASVEAIDGEAPTGYLSRTGAARQTFNAAGIARREINKSKRLSACSIIQEETV